MYMVDTNVQGHLYTMIYWITLLWYRMGHNDYCFSTQDFTQKIEKKYNLY